MSNAARWGIVTFVIGCGCGIIGHFMGDLSFLCVIVVAVVGAVLGAQAISGEST